MHRVALVVYSVVPLLRRSNGNCARQAWCLRIKRRCEAGALSLSSLSLRTGSENLLCTIVYCTVKFKGKCESSSMQISKLSL